MALLLVAGGTGRAGRAVVDEARRRGWEVRSLSRHLPSPERTHDDVEYFSGDVAAGVGLAAALDGVDVVVDTLEAMRGRALKDYPLAGRRLLDAARGSGVRHAVSLSIAACDEFTFGYYSAKVAKERIYAEHPLPTSVVRCAQFHDLFADIFALAQPLGIVPALRARVQPIDLRDVARALVDTSGAEPEPSRLWTASGPEVLSMRTLAEEWKLAAGVGGRVVSIPLPGRNGRALSTGRNLVPGSAFGTITFGAWLRERYAAAEQV